MSPSAMFWRGVCFFWWACLKDSGGLSRHISPDLVQASLAADLSTSSPDVHPTSFIPFTTLPPVILTTSISSQQCLHLTTALVKSSWAHKKCEVHWSVKQGKRQKKCNEDMFVSFNVLFNLLGWFNMIYNLIRMVSFCQYYLEIFPCCFTVVIREAENRHLHAITPLATAICASLKPPNPPSPIPPPLLLPTHNFAYVPFFSSTVNEGLSDTTKILHDKIASPIFGFLLLSYVKMYHGIINLQKQQQIIHKG